MGGAMLSEYRKLVYAGDRCNDNTLSFAIEIHFTASGFFLKILTVSTFLSLFLFGLVFFAHYEKQKKKKQQKKTKKKKKNKKT